jgi:hypothetical protein
MFIAINTFSQTENVPWYEKFKKTPFDSLSSSQKLFFIQYFDDLNLQEAQRMYDSLSYNTDVIYHKRTMAVVEVRTLLNIESYSFDYSVFTSDFYWGERSLSQFDDMPYYPGQGKPRSLIRVLCEEVSKGDLVAYNKNGVQYSIEDFEKTFYYRKFSRSSDSLGNPIWEKEYVDELPYIDERVFRYIVIEDWYCDNNLNFYSEIRALAPLKIVYTDVSVGLLALSDQELMFWIINE